MKALLIYPVGLLLKAYLGFAFLLIYIAKVKANREARRHVAAHTPKHSAHA